MRDEELAIDVNRKIKAQILENLKSSSEGSAEVPFQLVLGGVCIMVPAIVSAFREALEPQGRKVGVIWFDADADLSLPGDATNVLGCIAFSQMVMREGALESMGEFSAPRHKHGHGHVHGHGHGHGEDYTAVGVSNPENTVLFGLNTTREGVIPREHLTYLLDNHYRVFSSSALSRSLLAARTCATQALEYLTSHGCNAIIVHVDVDAIDGGEFPLGNLPNFTGTSFEQFMAALDVFLGEKRVVGLNLTEMNPDRDTGLVMTGRLVDAVVESFRRRASEGR